jgi:small-conductance mechanosensitive channel
VSDALQNWLFAATVIVAALAAGVVIDLIVVWALNHDLGPGQRGRRALAKALRGQPEIWAVLIAFELWDPLHFLEGRSAQWADRIVIALAVLSVTLFLARLAGWLIRAYLSHDSVTAPGGSIFVNLTRLLIWAVGITFMLGALGVQIGPLVASLGVVGIAVSLGLQDTLANFFSGLQITTSRQIQPGDYIRLSTMEEGTVTDVTWRNTTMRSPSNDLVIVPNSVIGRAQITNFTAGDESHTLALPFTVAFGSDVDSVKRIAEQAAREVRDAEEAADNEFEPVCRFRAFGPDGISATVTIRVVRFQDRLPVVDELGRKLYSALAESGVTFGTGIASLAARPPV